MEYNYKNTLILIGIMVIMLLIMTCLHVYKFNHNRNTTELKCYEITQSDIKQIKCN